MRMATVRHYARGPHGRSRTLVALLPVFLAAACGGRREVGDPPPEPGEGDGAMAAVLGEACGPVTPSLAPDASLSRMAGSYRLRLSTRGTPPTASQGTLVLESLPEQLNEMAGAATPLGGTTDIDVEAVGVLRLGDLASTDPAAPGVLVIESGGPSIILRLGSESNRRDQASFDGGFSVLTVERIGSDGFDGSWRSGTRDRVNEGYFCARRNDD